MAYTFNSEPPLPASLVGTAVEGEVERRRQQAAVQRAVEGLPPIQRESERAPPRIDTRVDPSRMTRDIYRDVERGAKDYDRGVAAAVALTDAAHAEEEMAAQTQAIPVGANVSVPSNYPVKESVAQPAKVGPDLTPKRAATFFEAVQGMDPLGKALIAGAMEVDPRVFQSEEELEIEKRSRESVLRWRTAMDDPNSAERKALDGGDLPSFLKLATSAGAVDPLAFVNTMAELRSSDERRNAYGFDAKVYDQALVPIMSKSSTMSNAALALTSGDAPMVAEDGRVISFDGALVMSTPGAIEDVSRSVATAASEDLLGTRDMRPYVMAANTAFFDQIGSYLAAGLEFDPATGVATFPEFEHSIFGDEPTAALTENIKAYINHQRVALVASRRYAPEAVKAMDDMQVLSIATGKPRIAAIIDGEGNPVLGDAKSILQQQTLFAPNGYNTILQGVLPEGAGTGDEKPASGGDKKKPAAKKAP